MAIGSIDERLSNFRQNEQFKAIIEKNNISSFDFLAKDFIEEIENSKEAITRLSEIIKKMYGNNFW
jgi:delta-aminolevulinic acid dehydratase/porphobilinogen synthase